MGCDLMPTIKYTREDITKLENERDQYKRERDTLITDIKKQRELLKDFSKFIHRKVVACPGKKEYVDFRDSLNELGITEAD